MISFANCNVRNHRSQWAEEWKKKGQFVLEALDGEVYGAWIGVVSSVSKDIVISTNERIQKDSTERDLNEPLARILKNSFQEPHTRT